MAEQSQGLDIPPQPNDSISILEASIDSRNSETFPRVATRARAIGMAVHLDGYINSLVDVEIERSGGQALREEVSSRFERARQFFLTNGEFGITPIERIAQIYETLTPPEEDRDSFEEAVSQHSQELMERAFDQHLGNPEKFVSHDFGHTLRDADYIRDITERGNYQILAAACHHYGLTEGEAKFVFQLIALSHDFGYPYLGEWTKSFHSFPAVEIISSPKMRETHNILLRPTKDREILFENIYDAVLRHSADKIEAEFPVEMHTRGQKTLLGHGESLLQLQMTQAEGEGVDYAIRVVVRDEDTRQQLLRDLNEKATEFEARVGTKFVIPEVEVIEGSNFKGRKIKSRNPDEPGFGLEYSQVDITTSPFQAAIRIADNMDFTANRLSEIQQDDAFQEICRAFGNNGIESLELQEFEARGDQEAETAYKRRVIDTILLKPEHAERLKDKPDIVEKIIGIGLGQTSESYRHFGGCHAIKKVKFAAGMMHITVDGDAFRRANAVKVEEKSLDDNGQEVNVNVGVGEYQIWRLEEALNSITMHTRGIPIWVYDKDLNIVDERGNYFR